MYSNEDGDLILGKRTYYSNKLRNGIRCVCKEGYYALIWNIMNIYGAYLQCIMYNIIKEIIHITKKYMFLTNYDDYTIDVFYNFIKSIIKTEVGGKMEKIKMVIVDDSPFSITTQTIFRKIYLNAESKRGANEWM